MHSQSDLLLEIQNLKLNPTFLAPMFEKTMNQRTDSSHTLHDDSRNSLISMASEETIVDKTRPKLLDLPLELIEMVAMFSGFKGALALRQTNRKLRKHLNQKQSWRHFTSLSSDVIETTVDLGMRVHQFDQFIFGIRNGLPSVIHRSYLENYCQNGISFQVLPSGRVKTTFWEIESTDCCSDSDSKCSNCQANSMEILKSLFVHEAMTAREQVNFTFAVDSTHRLTVGVEETTRVFGYTDEEEIVVSSRVAAINGCEFTKGLKALYSKFVL